MVVASSQVLTTIESAFTILPAYLYFYISVSRGASDLADSDSSSVKEQFFPHQAQSETKGHTSGPSNLQTRPLKGGASRIGGLYHKNQPFTLVYEGTMDFSGSSMTEDFPETTMGFSFADGTLSTATDPYEESLSTDCDYVKWQGSQSACQALNHLIMASANEPILQARLRDDGLGIGTGSKGAFSSMRLMLYPIFYSSSISDVLVFRVAASTFVRPDPWIFSTQHE